MKTFKQLINEGIFQDDKIISKSHKEHPFHKDIADDWRYKHSVKNENGIHHTFTHHTGSTVKGQITLSTHETGGPQSEVRHSWSVRKNDKHPVLYSGSDRNSLDGFLNKKSSLRPKVDPAQHPMFKDANHKGYIPQASKKSEIVGGHQAVISTTTHELHHPHFGKLTLQTKSINGKTQHSWDAPNLKIGGNTQKSIQPFLKGKKPYIDEEFEDKFNAS